MPNDLNISHLLSMQAYQAFRAPQLERLAVIPGFHGIWVPLITPFKDGRVDVTELGGGLDGSGFVAGLVFEARGVAGVLG